MNAIEARTKIIDLHRGIITSARRSVQEAILIGEIISEQKMILSHGEFIPWISTLPFDDNTAYRYLKLNTFSNKIPTVGNLQEAYKQIETLEAQEKQSKEQRQRSLIAEYRKTGKKPEGWTRDLDYVIKKDAENEIKYMERMEKEKRERQQRVEDNKNKQNAENLYGDILLKATNDLINKEKERQEWKEQIRLSDNGKDNCFNDAIMDYLDSLENYNRRIGACNNIIKICRNISVQLQKIEAK
jgi:hypothetical protein